jgi:hypothetical protein
VIKASWKGSVEGDADDLVKVVDAAMRHFAALVQSQRQGVVSAGDFYDSRYESPFADSAFNPGGSGVGGPGMGRDVPDAPTVAPDAPWTQTEPSTVPSSGAPSLDKATEEQLAEGADLWMGLLTTWQRGFMDEEAEQPDRLDALASAVTQGGSCMFAALHHYGGLTRLVRSLMAQMPKKRARRIAENIAQVASAAGIPVIADYLEYTKEYLGKEYQNG